MNTTQQTAKHTPVKPRVGEYVRNMGGSGYPCVSTIISDSIVTVAVQGVGHFTCNVTRCTNGLNELSACGFTSAQGKEN